MDAHVNAYDTEHMQMWRQLANQSHWHLVLVGEGDKVVDLFEFKNTFGLDSTLDQVEAACNKVPGGSFDLAKAEFSAKYAIDDLFRL